VYPLLRPRANEFLLEVITSFVLVVTGLASSVAGQEVPAGLPQPPQAARGQNAGAAPSGGPLDQAVVDRGHQAFTQNCGFCHGADARGGAEDGPDLTHSAMIVSDASGQQLSAFLKVGKPPKMPSFSNLTDEEVTEIATYLRIQAAAGRGRRVDIVIVGDPKAGEAYFSGSGKCNTCHSVTGDLKGIGGKYTSLMLEGRIVLPRGSGGYPGRIFPGQQAGPPDLPQTVTVTPTSGGALSGTLVYVSDFYVTLRDASGITHTFSRNGDSPRVVIKDPLQGHLDMMKKLTDKDMHDLTAYLVTLK
jgi:cytochrome c oxidase cbb3-type subunit III